MARPVKGTDLVDALEGSEVAKTRLKTILDQMQGRLTVKEACEALGVGRSTYFELRSKALTAAMDGLAARPRGRPPRQADPEELEVDVEALKAKYEHELMELRIANVKEELRLVLPEVVIGTPEYDAAQKKLRNRRKRQRKKRR